MVVLYNCLSLLAYLDRLPWWITGPFSQSPHTILATLDIGSQQLYAKNSTFFIMWRVFSFSWRTRPRAFASNFWSGKVCCCSLKVPPSSPTVVRSTLEAPTKPQPTLLTVPLNLIICRRCVCVSVCMFTVPCSHVQGDGGKEDVKRGCRSPPPPPLSCPHSSPPPPPFYAPSFPLAL